MHRMRLLVIFKLPLGVALYIALFNCLLFIKALFAAAQRNFNFNQVVLKVKGDGHKRHTLGVYFSDYFVNFKFVKQKFSVALAVLGVERAALVVNGYVHIFQRYLPLADKTETVFQIAVSRAQRLNFRALQNYSRLVFLLDKILERSRFVVSNLFHKIIINLFFYNVKSIEYKLYAPRAKVAGGNFNPHFVAYAKADFSAV